jgi:hypothetical protein
MGIPLDFLTTPSIPLKRIRPKPQNPWISNYCASMGSFLRNLTNLSSFENLKPVFKLPLTKKNEKEKQLVKA